MDRGFELEFLALDGHYQEEGMEDSYGSSSGHQETLATVSALLEPENSGWLPPFWGEDLDLNY